MARTPRLSARNSIQPLEAICLRRIRYARVKLPNAWVFRGDRCKIMQQPVPGNLSEIFTGEGFRVIQIDAATP